MYSAVGVAKLSETQKSRLRNGHPVRIKIGSGNKLNLTNEQVKKLQSAARKNAAYTLVMHPEQAEKHGQGLFGDIYSKAKAIAKKNKDLINPIIGRVKAGVHSGIDKLSSAAKSKVDQYIQPIEGEGMKKRRGRPKKKVGEGIIGDALKGLIGMSGLGMKKRGRPKKAATVATTITVVKKAAKTKKGKGILGALVKAVAPAIIDAAAGAAKGKVQGMGIKKRGRPKKRKAGGALYAAGYSGP